MSPHTIHDGHQHVHQHRVGRLTGAQRLEYVADRLLSVGGCGHAHADAAEQEVQDTDVLRIIIHDVYVHAVESHLEVVRNGETHVAGGTLFGNNMPRLIRLGDYRMEAYLDGVLLVFVHDDVPGIIGTVGTILGNHQINIAQMAVGREGDSPGGTSIGVLNLDELPKPKAIEEVLRHQAIHHVQVIELPKAGQLPPWL